MANNPKKKLVEVDGRTGEGGGQLVRIAVGLSALTGTPIRIHHVRGSRAGKRGGGLKAQHASCIEWLAEATKADVRGCFEGSHEFTFRPLLSPAKLINRNIKIDIDSAGSTLLVLQAIFPFLLFAGDDKDSPISITIRGGTNVSFSLSYEYLDQVLLPTFERLGVPKVERKIEYCRGWTHGPRQIGGVTLIFIPLSLGNALQGLSWPSFSDPGTVERIDINMIVPQDLRDALKTALDFELSLVFPGTKTQLAIDEDSQHGARMYTLLVAHTTNGYRFGRDWLFDKSTKGSMNSIATEIAQKVVDDLDIEIRKGGCVDEYLQDQLIVYQAISEGKTTVIESFDTFSDTGRLDRSNRPFGTGSLHTQTARWICSQMLPRAKWTVKGRNCQGIGMRIINPPHLDELPDLMALKEETQNES